mmetsp:Transcript_22406/g.88961  ORF Transcript_22406/g.88961 Transcript_22406/m.88961 type:complete len:209 (+) Transcript_22406:89-715(+)
MTRRRRLPRVSTRSSSPPSPGRPGAARRRRPRGRFGARRARARWGGTRARGGGPRRTRRRSRRTRTTPAGPRATPRSRPRPSRRGAFFFRVRFAVKGRGARTARTGAAGRDPTGGPRRRPLALRPGSASERRTSREMPWLFRRRSGRRAPLSSEEQPRNRLEALSYHSDAALGDAVVDVDVDAGFGVVVGFGVGPTFKRSPSSGRTHT